MTPLNLHNKCIEELGNNGVFDFSRVALRRV